MATSGVMGDSGSCGHLVTFLAAAGRVDKLLHGKRAAGAQLEARPDSRHKGTLTHWWAFVFKNLPPKSPVRTPLLLQSTFNDKS